MRFFIILPLIALSTTQALAQNLPIKTDVGGKEITLLTTPGQCPFNSEDPKDANEIAITKKSLDDLELLHFTADCKQLKLWRKGDQPDYGSFAYTTVISSLKTKDFTGKENVLIKSVCDEMRKAAKQKKKFITKDLETRLTKTIKEIKNNKKRTTRILGVMSEDDTACYTSMLINYKNPKGNPKTLYATYAMTVLKGRILGFYNYADVEVKTAASIPKRLLATQKATVANHYAANLED